jgi:protein-S-isoprenylcysteine O-methyltransferase Ste14
VRVTLAGLREAGANLALAALYFLFAGAHLRAFAAHLRPSLLLVVALETAAAALFLLRSRASQTSFSLHSWLTTLGGTFAPLLLRPSGAARDVLAGQVVQSLGTALAIVSLLSLWRSFGLLPAVRDIRVGGAYRWVRHPLYSAYAVQNLGYLVSNWSPLNLAIVAFAILFQVLRVYNEERLLWSVAAYRRYARRTRWRMVPLVF